MEYKDQNQGYARFAGYLQLSETLFFQQKEHDTLKVTVLCHSLNVGPF